MKKDIYEEYNTVSKLLDKKIAEYYESRGEMIRTQRKMRRILGKIKAEEIRQAKELKTEA